MLVERPVANVPGAVAVALRHCQQRVDYVRNVDEVSLLLASAVDQDGLFVLEPLREDCHDSSF
jgi:hypothetical protein